MIPWLIVTMLEIMYTFVRSNIILYELFIFSLYSFDVIMYIIISFRKYKKLKKAQFSFILLLEFY